MLRLVALAGVALAAAENTLSFAAPFGEINQFSGLRHINGWEVGGSAEVHRSFVRLTAERQGQKGYMVSHNPLQMKEWSMMLEIRASGMSPHLYGDGAPQAARGPQPASVCTMGRRRVLTAA